MSITILLLIAVVLIALVFEFINGFHDCANAIATVVSTKVLSPKQAVLFGASLEFIGALTGTHVAKTIGAGIVNGEMITLTVIFCALLSAVIWNLFTWWLGLPSSSSHALIGGLLGATIVKAGVDAIHVKTLIDKVIIPMFTSPVLGFCVGFTIMLLLAWLILILRAHPDSVNKKFVFTGNHNHEAIGTKALYTKINTIKRKNDKYELVLNKLYFNPTRSEYITTDPLGINRVYNSKEYMHTTEDGEDVDLTKLSANYENNFDELKNVGTRYKYTFSI